MKPGEQVGQLRVLELRPNDRALVRCLVCDGTKLVWRSAVRERSRSCGCIRLQAMSLGRRRHGHTRSATAFRSPTYKSWDAMTQRCSNPNNNAFQRYGAVGIDVCERWRLFENFLADMGPRPAGTSIDRIDNAKGYEPANCRWATRIEQARNQRRPDRHGERCPTAKLTQVSVECLRAVADAGVFGRSQLAAWWHVSPTTVSQIVRRQTWK